MGGFWNPHGGFIVNDRRLSRKEVSLLKRTWSKQLRLSDILCNGWWRKTKRVMTSFFK